MMEYKVCFHISYWCPWLADSIAKHVNKSGKSKAKRGHGKLHFCGRDLEEAVAKVRGFVASNQARGELDPERGKGEFTKCTSMWVMRGRDKGLNITWEKYHSKGELKRLWQEALAEARAYWAERPQFAQRQYDH